MPEVYRKPSAAASVAVLAREDRVMLVIRRSTEPFKGLYAFPGGYLDVDQEDLPHTAVRELREEAGLVVPPESLKLIDVRSSPRRDPRGHTIDVGYFAVLERKAEIALHTNEARPEWAPVDRVDRLEFAFDHREFWSKVREHIQTHGLLTHRP